MSNKEDWRDSVHGWSHGGGPDQFGWVFEKRYNVTAERLNEAETREQAYNMGVSEAVLDAFDGEYTGDIDNDLPYGEDLCGWLQGHCLG